MKNFLRFGGLLLVLFTTTASFAQTSPNGQVDTDRLLQNIEAAQSKITSLQSTVEMNAQNFVPVWKAEGGQNFPPPPVHDITIYAFKGEKRYMETLQSSADSPEALKSPLNQVTRRVVFDGKQNYFTEQPKKGKENLRPALWSPMPGNGSQLGVIERMYNVGTKNVADVIRNKLYTSIATSDSPKFGPLVSIDLDAKQVSSTKSDDTIHLELAPAFGYAIVRQRYTSKDGYGEQQITKFTKLRGILLPVEAENKQYTSDKVYSPDEQMMPFRFETWHFSNTNLNHVPDSLFAIKMKPGDILENDTSRYRIGANGERVLEWGDNGTRSRKMLFGWLFMASLATLLLLGIGFLVRYQRRSSAR